MKARRRHPSYTNIFRLRADLWRIPFSMSLVAVVLFLAAVTVDLAAARGVRLLPGWFSVGGAEDARAVLTSMLGAVSTVLALIFSVALLVLSMAATQFGSRILYRFIRDGVTQITIGMFLASFVHTLLALVVTRQQGSREFVPHLATLFSIVLVAMSFALLVFFSHRIATSIQAQHVVSSIVADLDRTITEARASVIFAGQPLPTQENLAARDAMIARCAAEGTVVGARRSGFVQEVEVWELVRAADAADATIRLLYRPGAFIMQDAPLCQVRPAARSSELLPAIHRSILIGPRRTLRQDVEFGIAQLVEIALRAMSPAINDVFTGLTCIDWLGDELRVFTEGARPMGVVLGDGGTIRLIWPPLRSERLVKAAFDQIRQATVGNAGISIRLLQTFTRLAGLIEDAECRAALLQQAEAVWEAVPTLHLVKCDVADIEKAYRAARQAFGAQ